MNRARIFYTLKDAAAPRLFLWECKQGRKTGALFAKVVPAAIWTTPRQHGRCAVAAAAAVKAAASTAWAVGRTPSRRSGERLRGTPLRKERNAQYHRRTVDCCCLPTHVSTEEEEAAASAGSKVRAAYAGIGGDHGNGDGAMWTKWEEGEEARG